MTEGGHYLLVDAHVHFYPCFSRDVFFASASGNLRKWQRELGLEGTVQGCLLLAETSRDFFFRELAECVGSTLSGGWRVKRTAEDGSLVLHCEGEMELLVVAGRQIATAEGLELLALCCNREFRDGMSLKEAIRIVSHCDGLPVLPWGFGKWWFRRGQWVREALGWEGTETLFLGDNAGRLSFAPEPRLFEVARSGGRFILPGSDPLPFRSQADRPGCYGFVLEERLHGDEPSRSLKQILRRRTDQPRTFGRLERLAPFCSSRLRLQVRMFQKNVASAGRAQKSMIH